MECDDREARRNFAETRRDPAGSPTMELFIALVLWCLLSVLCGPLALLSLVLFPLVWLAALPFRSAAIVVVSSFALSRAVLMLPARLLGGGGPARGAA